MLTTLWLRKGQSAAEYAIVLSVVVAAAIAMQTYVKRSMQGGVKFAVDKLSVTEKGKTGQYEPYYIESTYESTTKTYTDEENVEADGKVIRKIGKDAGKETQRTGYQKLKDVSTAD